MLPRKPVATATISNVAFPARADEQSTKSHAFSSPEGDNASLFSSPKRKAPLRKMLLSWLLMFFTVVFFILTVYYALRPILGPRASWVGSSPSHAVLVLRILSECAGLFFAATVASSTETLQWMLVSRRKGVNLPTLLGLQPGTGVLGLLSLMVSPKIEFGGRSWSFGRLCLIAVVPVLGVVIMSDVTTQTVFQSQNSFNVAAGIGSFNSSFAEEYSSIAGIYFATDFTNFLSDPKRVAAIAPLTRSNASCTTIRNEKDTPSCGSSYFMSGGLDLISPWPQKNNDLPDAGFYTVHNLLGYQLDYFQLEGNANFDGVKDCRVYGNRAAAIQICLSNTIDNRLDAKFVHCPIILSSSNACLQNTTWHGSTGWATSLIPHQRHATISFSRTNGSIFSVMNPSAPLIPKIQPFDLFSAYDLSFGNSSLSGFGGQASTQFIQFVATTLTFAETSSLAFRSAELYLRNLLALPLYYYHANNLSPTISPSPDKPLPGLPQELYVRASLATAWHKLIVGKTTVWVYIIGGALAILACMTILVLGSMRQTAGNIPDTTPWSALDFAVHCCGVAQGGREQTIGERLREFRGLTGSSALKERMGETKVFVMSTTTMVTGASSAPRSPHKNRE